MKIIVIAAALVVVIAVCANIALGFSGFSTEAQNTSSSVRLDSPSK